MLGETLRASFSREVSMRILAIAVLALSGACAAAAGEQSETETYVPGFGEFMSATQVRLAKLWFAGKARNWELAEYELGEIEEGLEDATRLHPTHDNVPVATMIESILLPRLKDLSTAIAAKDGGRFDQAFDDLTAACNKCHGEAGKGFIRIQRPTAPPVSNQVFDRAKQ